MDETIYFLEMTAQDQLLGPPAGGSEIELKEATAADAELVRSTYNRIGAPLSWSGRMGWSEEQWHDELARPEVHAWTAVVDHDVAGLVELETVLSGDVGIVIFGLVPGFIGRGLGGALLTIVAELAWRLPRAGRDRTRRVWVQTSSHDHPHALPNYEARGFRLYEVEHRSMPGEAAGGEDVGS